MQQLSRYHFIKLLWKAENLLSLLLAIFLNDLETGISSKYDGLSHLKKTMVDLSDDDVQVYLNMLLILYVDDTIILSENPKDLQKGLNGMYTYCKDNKLCLNVSKTKVVIFSKERIESFQF